MNIVEAIRSRKSIRGFKPEGVPKEILREVLEIATRAPSAMNTQPWEFAVLTGNVLDEIRDANVAMLSSRLAGDRTLPRVPLEGVYRQRQVDLAIQLFNLMGIARDDREKRAEWGLRGLRFFDAPAAIILYVESSRARSYVDFDLGAFAQTICLAALSYGLGTCIEDQGVLFPEVVRRFTGIPESKRIVVSIALGYPDWDFPANRLETSREPVGNIAKWCGFD